MTHNPIRPWSNIERRLSRLSTAAVRLARCGAVAGQDFSIELATDVLFSSGSATLSADGISAIQEVAKVLASIPGRKFQVEGHTDDVPIKTAQYASNWELASGRAITVVKTMVDAGLPGDRVSGASFGEQKPTASNKTPEGRASNRRIEIVVVPDLASLPGFDELNRAAAKP